VYERYPDPKREGRKSPRISVILKQRRMFAGLLDDGFAPMTMQDAPSRSTAKA